MNKQDFIDIVLEKFRATETNDPWEGVINPPVDEKYANDFLFSFTDFYLDRFSDEIDEEIAEEDIYHEVSEWSERVWAAFCENEKLVKEFAQESGLAMPKWKE